MTRLKAESCDIRTLDSSTFGHEVLVGSIILDAVPGVIEPDNGSNRRICPVSNAVSNVLKLEASVILEQLVRPTVVKSTVEAKTDCVPSARGPEVDRVWVSLPV